MYNGIGLPTPRGSGTSGYIQKNLSLVKKNIKTRDEFLKELQQLKVLFVSYYNNHYFSIY